MRTNRIRMSKWVLATRVGALVVLTVAAATAPVPAWAASAGPTGRLAARLEPGVQALFETGMAPGLSVAVVQDGAIVYAQAFGVADLESGRAADLDTRFYIASTTKSLTALTAALLANQRRVDLDAPISKYLPKLRLKEPLSPDSISLRDLLTHTHGIENGGPVTFRTAYSGDHTEALLLRLLAQHGPAEHGRAFEYGNIGYNVAGLVLRAATGSDWKALMEREVLKPAGMNRTTPWMSRASKDVAMPHQLGIEGFTRVRPTKDDATMHAAGGLVATASDLARFLEAELGGGSIGGTQVFPAAVIAETQRVQAAQDSKFMDYARHGWGLGWDVGTYEADTLLHRFGSYAGTYFSHLSFMPHRGLGVVVLVNEGRVGGMLATMVANSIYDRLLDKPGADSVWAAETQAVPGRLAGLRKRLAEDLARRAARPQETAHPLALYAGTYENPNLGRMTWTVKGSRLHAALGNLAGEAEVFDGAKDQFRVELTGAGEVIGFEMADGKAIAMTYEGERFVRR